MKEQELFARSVRQVLTEFNLGGVSELLVKERIGKHKSKFELRGITPEGRKVKVEGQRLLAAAETLASLEIRAKVDLASHQAD